MLEETISVLKFKAESKGLDIFYEIEQNFPEFIITDENRVRQVIINLISNAIKYTISGHVKITALHSKNSNKIELSVSDTGTGIEENDLKDLFSVFTKIMKNRSLNKEGCGLGLTISRNIATALNGDLTVSS